MKLVLMLMLTLICWSFVAANEETVDFPFKGLEQDAKKGDIDLLSHPVCNHLRENGFCKTSSSIKDKLCHATCRCDDVFAKKSCDFIKKKNKCAKDLAVLYCKWTCGMCFTACKFVSALGMQSRAISDSRITASSTYNSSFLPQKGRLFYMSSRGKGGTWSAKYRRVGEWLQVDLGKITVVTAVATQGRYDVNQRVTRYSLQYSKDGRSFKNYQGGKVFAGNKAQHTVVKHALRPFITARYIRLVVRTWYGGISLRMELYGCKR